jgi:hypothetical protein
MVIINSVRRLALVALSLLSATASAELPHRATMKNGSYADHEAGWQKFAILGIKLGTPLEKVPGFTCGPPPGTNGFTTQNHGCVKFLDTRCKGRATKIHHIRVAADVPPGQTCFMDEFSGGTYLDRRFVSPPLSAVHIIGTDTSAPLVFEIHYTFAADDLTDDSKLGKALIAKYGPPTFKNAPIQMGWELGDVRLSASCRSTVGAQGEYCEITVEDRTLDGTERELQEAANEAEKRQNAPAAPNL